MSEFNQLHLWNIYPYYYIVCLFRLSQMFLLQSLHILLFTLTYGTRCVHVQFIQFEVWFSFVSSIRNVCFFRYFAAFFKHFVQFDERNNPENYFKLSFEIFVLINSSKDQTSLAKKKHYNKNQAFLILTDRKFTLIILPNLGLIRLSAL